MNCWFVISWQHFWQLASFLHARNDLLNDLEGEWTWNHGLELGICYVNILVLLILETFQSGPQLVDWRMGQISPGLNISNDLPVLALHWVWVIVKVLTFLADSLLIYRAVMNTSSKGLTFLMEEITELTEIFTITMVNYESKSEI